MNRTQRFKPQAIDDAWEAFRATGKFRILELVANEIAMHDAFDAGYRAKASEADQAQATTNAALQPRSESHAEAQTETG